MVTRCDGSLVKTFEVFYVSALGDVGGGLFGVFRRFFSKAQVLKVI
jgi:hypothetical protein